VEHHEIRPAGVELPEPLTPVRGVVDGRAAPLEQRPDQPPNVVVVVDHEDGGSVHTVYIPRPCAVPSCVAESMRVATILIVDPDPATRSLLELLCHGLGHDPIGPREWVDGEEPDLVLLEPASRPGVRLPRGGRRRFPQLPTLRVSIARAAGPRRATPVPAVADPVRVDRWTEPRIT